MNPVYSEAIRRWVGDDRRTGILAAADGIGEVGLDSGEAGKRLAVRFTLRLREEYIEAIRYQVFGCGFTIAACAAAAELAEGQTLDEVSGLAPAQIDVALAGLPPERAYCAELAAAALQAAVESARTGRILVTETVGTAGEATALPTAASPVYRRLIGSPSPAGAPPEDRHLFACLIAAAAGETTEPAAALGLSSTELADLLRLYFPAVTAENLAGLAVLPDIPPPDADADLRQLLLDYLPRDCAGRAPPPALWLARIMATRAARPGHLWQAMGLHARPELTAAIRRHLPALAAANGQGMRWKRFLFRELCQRGGGVLCKAPDCGTCSDYPLCFAE